MPKIHAAVYGDHHDLGEYPDTSRESLSAAMQDACTRRLVEYDASIYRRVGELELRTADSDRFIGTIGRCVCDTRATPDERRQSRAERYNTYAEHAAQRRDQQWEKARQIGLQIPTGQPILVGHHSEQRHRAAIARQDAAGFKGLEEHRKAEYWASKAAGAENNRAVYQGDPEAVEKLRAQLDALEAKHARRLEINKGLRAGKSYADLQCTDDEVRELTWFARYSPGGTKGNFPGYELTNTTANIRRIRQRLEALKVDNTPKVRRPYWLTARKSGTCSKCSAPLTPGASILYSREDRAAWCAPCGRELTS